jgi:hypothetical protein
MVASEPNNESTEHDGSQANGRRFRWGCSLFRVY